MTSAPPVFLVVLFAAPLLLVLLTGRLRRRWSNIAGRFQNSVTSMFSPKDVAELADRFQQVVAETPGAPSSELLAVAERLAVCRVPVLMLERRPAPPPSAFTAQVSAPLATWVATFEDGTELALGDVPAPQAARLFEAIPSGLTLAGVTPGIDGKARFLFDELHAGTDPLRHEVPAVPEPDVPS